MVCWESRLALATLPVLRKGQRREQAKGRKHGQECSFPRELKVWNLCHLLSLRNWWESQTIKKVTSNLLDKYHHAEAKGCYESPEETDTAQGEVQPGQGPDGLCHRSGCPRAGPGLTEAIVGGDETWGPKSQVSCQGSGLKHTLFKF